jgi:hypothetical protein
MKVAQFAFAYYSQGTRLGSAGTLTECFGLFATDDSLVFGFTTEIQSHQENFL